MRRPVSTAYDIPIVLLLAAGAVAVFVAKDHRAALGLYRAYFLEPIALFYAAAELLKREEHLQRLVLAFAAGTSLFALLNLEVFTRALLAHDVRVGVAPNALYGNANYVAMYLEPPVALAAGLLLLGDSRRWKLLGGLWLVIVGSALDRHVLQGKLPGAGRSGRGCPDHGPAMAAADCRRIGSRGHCSHPDTAVAGTAGDGTELGQRQGAGFRRGAWHDPRPSRASVSASVDTASSSAVSRPRPIPTICG